MKLSNSQLALATLVLGLGALAPACSDSSAEREPSSSAAAPLPERFWAESEPGPALGVAAAHAAAEDGEHVVLVGQVGGSAKPFVDGAAVFTLVDSALRSCIGDGTGCATPWDYCCVDPTTLRKGIATVELREAGRPLRASARGFHGLDHLSTVVVEGTAERDQQGNLVLVADALRVRR